MQAVVEEQIYPNVTTGFTDSNAYLRELTLKSMLTLAPKLSQRTLSNSLLKFLAKLQVSRCTATRSVAKTPGSDKLQVLGLPTN